MTTPLLPAQAALLRRMKLGGDSFFAIAALSLLDLALGRFSLELQSIFALGVTQAAAQLSSSPSKMLIFAAEAVAVLLLVTLGFFARRGYHKAFLFGLTFYALDAVVQMFSQQYFSVGLHVLFLAVIVQGFRAAHDFYHGK